jgi:small subunit ribosomal protein S16
VAVKIKLKRLGKIRAPYYRIIVADARTKRDGRAIEEIGKYHPKSEPSLIEVDSERAQHWLSVGAQPTDPVRKILEVTGDWQKFKGLPGTEGTLRTAEPRADRKAAFAAAVAENLAGTEAKPKTRAKSEPKAPAKSESKAEKAPAKSESKAAKAPARARKSQETGAAEVAAAEASSAEPADETASAESAAETTPAESAAETTPAESAAETTPAESAAETTPAESAAETTPAKPANEAESADGAAAEADGGS